MKKAIGTMILLGASVAAVMTPAMAADREQRALDRGNRANSQTEPVWNRGQNDRRAPEYRREDGGGRNVRWRHERFRHERDHNDRRSRFGRDYR